MIYRSRSFFVVLDLISVCVSFLLALLARFGDVTPSRQQMGNGNIFLLLLVTYALVILFYRAKVEFEKRGLFQELFAVVSVNFYMAVLVTAFLYLFKIGENLSRGFYFLFFLYNCLFMYLFRVCFKRAVAFYYQKPENRKKILVCANETNVLKVLHKLQTSMSKDREIVAVAVFGPGLEALTNHQLELNVVEHGKYGTYMTSESDIEEYLKTQVIDEALISMPEYDKRMLNSFIKKLETMGIQVHVTINTFGLEEKEKTVENFGVYHVLTYAPRIFDKLDLCLKRCLDIVGGLVGVILTLILGIFVAPAIYLESPGPIVFKQVRIGTNGRRFYIYKFRSMYKDAEARLKELESQNEMSGGLMFKMKDDPRITKVGKFIRKTSIDEFPQFFNVLKGDMSLVGTRPPTEKEFLMYEEWHKRRLSLKPGITGMWQVSGRSSIQEFEDVVKLDLEYIDNWSFWLDIKILFQTVFVVLFQRGAE